MMDRQIIDTQPTDNLGVVNNCVKYKSTKFIGLYETSAFHTSKSNVPVCKVAYYMHSNVSDGVFQCAPCIFQKNLAVLKEMSCKTASDVSEWTK